MVMLEFKVLNEKSDEGTTVSDFSSKTLNSNITVLSRSLLSAVRGSLTADNS